MYWTDFDKVRSCQRKNRFLTSLEKQSQLESISDESMIKIFGSELHREPSRSESWRGR